MSQDFLIANPDATDREQVQINIYELDNAAQENKA
jgi:hypothetical protein